MVGGNSLYIQNGVGGLHNIVYTKDKNVVVFGKNDEGQLGLDDNIDRHEPTILMNDEKSSKLRVEIITA